MSSILLTDQTLEAAPIPEPPLRALAHIPGTDGWPFVGNTLQLVADPKGATERLAKRYGPIYRSHAFGGRSIALLGPEANEFVLLDQAKIFSSTHGWGRILELLFPRGLMLLDFDEHRLHRKALVGRLQDGPDEVLSQEHKQRRRIANCGMDENIVRSALLSSDETDDARSCRRLFSRRRNRPGC